MTPLYWRTLGFVACLFVLIGIGIDILDRTARNRVAIEKSCVLLNNAIIRSGAAGGGPSRILVDEILRNARQHHREFVIVQYKDALGKTKQVQLVNCEQVAKEPGDIKADPLPAAPPRTK